MSEITFIGAETIKGSIRGRVLVRVANQIASLTRPLAEVLTIRSVALEFGVNETSRRRTHGLYALRCLGRELRIVVGVQIHLTHRFLPLAILSTLKIKIINVLINNLRNKNEKLNHTH